MHAYVHTGFNVSLRLESWNSWVGLAVEVGGGHRGPGSRTNVRVWFEYHCPVLYFPGGVLQSVTAPQKLCSSRWWCLRRLQPSWTALPCDLTTSERSSACESSTQVVASDRSTIVLPGCPALVACGAGEDALLRRPLTGSMHGSLASLCGSSACRRVHQLKKPVAEDSRLGVWK